MERSLRVARVATFVYCVLDGTLMGMWLVQIPAVEKRVGISHAALGSLLVLLGHGPRSARGEGLQPPHYVRLARHLLRRSMARGPWDDLCA